MILLFIYLREGKIIKVRRKASPLARIQRDGETRAAAMTFNASEQVAPAEFINRFRFFIIIITISMISFVSNTTE